MKSNDMSEFSNILLEAKQAYNEAVSNVPGREKLWGWGFPHMEEYWKTTNESMERLLHYAEVEPHIAVNHHNKSHLQGFVAERMLQYLGEKGMDISRREFRPAVLSSPDFTFHVAGKTLTTDFLYRLGICANIQDHLELKELNTILELGAGLGTLSRCIKLINPKVKYFILDLPETLLFSFCYLRSNFPNASYKYVTKKEDMAGGLEGYEFVFIPSHFCPELPKLSIDLAINTHSLGEMRQEHSLYYMKLFQTHLQVRHFYSLNRYLEPYRTNPEASVSTMLDPHWTTLRWDFNPKITVIDRPTIPVDLMCTLELLVERIPESKRKELDYGKLGQEWLTRAKETELKGQAWHRSLWESVRLNPNIENLSLYVEFLGNAECREWPYYRDLLISLGGQVPQIAPSAQKLFAQRQSKMRRKIRGMIRAFGKKILAFLGI